MHDFISSMTPPSFSLLVDNVRSRWNVGSLFRTSEALSLKKIYLCGTTPYPPHPEISKVALNAERVVPWEYHTDAFQIAQTLKDSGVVLYALEQTPDSIPYDSIQPTQDFCLILGQEISGVSKEILEISDVILEIPMYGRVKKSLNLSVAFGIAGYALQKSE